MGAFQISLAPGISQGACRRKHDNIGSILVANGSRLAHFETMWGFNHFPSLPIRHAQKRQPLQDW
jgi:hypothetical protein